MPARHQLAHFLRGEAAEAVHLLGLRVLRVHRDAQPDVLHFDVLEESGVEALDVILVPVGGDDQVEALLALLRSGRQFGLEVLHGLREQLVASLLAAVDEDVKAAFGRRDADVDAVAATDVVGAD